MDVVTATVSNRIGYITLNRPDKRNALNDEMVKALQTQFDAMKNLTDVKVIVLKGNGKDFCAGADLAYLQRMQEFSYEENVADSTRLKNLFETIYTFPKPVIAQVQGAALAGGCGLATVCDFCIASDNATFGYTEVKIGFVPAIVSAYLLQKISGGNARYLLMTGDVISAKDAARMDLIALTFPDEQLTEAVEKFASDMVHRCSTQSLTQIKQMLSRMQNMSREEALMEGVKQNVQARTSADCKRGIQSFLAKEKIDWA